MTNGMQMVEPKDPVVELAEKLEQLRKAAEAKKRPLRVRMQPTVFNHENQLYAALPGVSWMFDAGSVEAIMDAKECLDLFFKAMGLIGGPEPMKDYMAQVVAAVEAEAEKERGK